MKNNTSIYGLVHNFKKEIGKEIAKTIAENGEMTAKEISLASKTQLSSRSIGGILAQRERNKWAESCVDVSLKIGQKKETTQKVYACVDNPEDTIVIKRTINKYYIKK
jgi:hypothetical protein